MDVRSQNITRFKSWEGFLSPSPNYMQVSSHFSYPQVNLSSNGIREIISTHVANSGVFSFCVARYTPLFPGITFPSGQYAANPLTAPVPSCVCSGGVAPALTSCLGAWANHDRVYCQGHRRRVPIQSLSPSTRSGYSVFRDSLCRFQHPLSTSAGLSRPLEHAGPLSWQRHRPRLDVNPPLDPPPRATVNKQHPEGLPI